MLLDHENRPSDASAARPELIFLSRDFFLQNYPLCGILAEQTGLVCLHNIGLAEQTAQKVLKMLLSTYTHPWYICVFLLWCSSST